MNSTPLLKSLAVVLVALTLAGCFQPSARYFQVGSTDGPVTLTLGIGDRGELSERYEVSGITRVKMHPLGTLECTDDAVYRTLTLRVRHSVSGRVLLERDLLEDPTCHGDRFVWDGDDLVELEESEPWPEDLYERPLPSPPPG